MIRLETVQRQDAQKAAAFIEQGRACLKAQGIDQWQDGYPNLDSVKEDIAMGRGYFIMKDSEPAGYLCLDFGGEPAYEALEGKWLKKGAYGVIHRMAIGDAYRGMGLSDTAFGLAVALCREKGVFSLRADTHADNLKMQHILSKQGFAYCGIVWYGTGRRLAYEKTIEM